MKTKICAAALAAALAGCASPPPAAPRPPPPDYSVPAVVEDAVDLTRDDNRQTVTFEGPNIAPNRDQLVMLRATRVRSTVVWQVYATDVHAGDWHFYQDAYDKAGQRLPFVSISRKVVSCRGACTVSESVAADVSREYLDRAAAGAGVAVRFGTRTAGTWWDVRIPPGYVAGFLAAVDKAR